MTTIKGLYENGEIKLLKKSPIAGTNKVLITFVEEDDEEIIRNITLQNSSEFMKEYLSDELEDLYQDYLK